MLADPFGGSTPRSCLYSAKKGFNIFIAPKMTQPHTHEEGETREALARPDKIFLDVRSCNLQKPQKG